MFFIVTNLIELNLIFINVVDVNFDIGVFLINHSSKTVTLEVFWKILAAKNMTEFLEKHL